MYRREMLVKAIHGCGVKFPEIAHSVVLLLMDFLGSDGATGVINFVRCRGCSLLVSPFGPPLGAPSSAGALALRMVGVGCAHSIHVTHFLPTHPHPCPLSVPGKSWRCSLTCVRASSPS